MITVLPLVALLSQSVSPSPVDALGWMSGCWQLDSGTRRVTEYWLPPDGGTMIGMSRAVSGGTTVEHEFLLLRAAEGRVEYVAKPSGQPEAVFIATSVTDSEAIFENPAHDFPSRIAYRRTGNSLIATISGLTKGKPRAVDYRYQAGTCTR